MRSSTYPCQENGVAIGRAVAYYDRAAHAFSAGIKCQHCSPEAYMLSACIHTVGQCNQYFILVHDIYAVRQGHGILKVFCITYISITAEFARFSSMQL